MVDQLPLNGQLTSTYTVRKGVLAYRYSNGMIQIKGQRYYGYSIKEALAKWRSNN